MALNDRLADNTVEALIELVQVLNTFRKTGAQQVYFYALYTGDDTTLGNEVQNLAEATSHVAKV